MVRPYKLHDSLRENEDGFEIMSFTEGPFMGVPFRINSIGLTDDGRLEYDYNLYIASQPNFDKDGFDEEVGQFLLELITDSIQNEIAMVDQETIKQLDEMWPDDNVNIVEEDE